VTVRGEAVERFRSPRLWVIFADTAEKLVKKY
jgi:hypothetical protein